MVSWLFPAPQAQGISSSSRFLRRAFPAWRVFCRIMARGRAETLSMTVDALANLGQPQPIA